MHPRNIYNTPPSFEELAKVFPEFARICQDAKGKLRVDFKDPEVARVFTKCCLLKDFQLDVNLPPDKLLPTLPLRLNYILWIEDLLKHCQVTTDVSGIDIGCGASCIYCLLAVRANIDWKMFALEIDDDNVNYARENVTSNQLSDKISIVHQQGATTIFKKLLEASPNQKTFCMCNPPFFSSANEVTNPANRTGNRKRPRSKNSGTPSELIYEDGGELAFAKKILDESIELQEKIQIYTTMLGCKRNLQQLVDEIRKRNIQSFTTTEFVQGKTTRWGVAWSFCHQLESVRDPAVISKKLSTSKNVLTHEIPTAELEPTRLKLQAIFAELKIQIKVIEESPNDFHRWELTAQENTWSNQRRKRRAGQASTDLTVDKSQDLHIGFELRSKAKAVQIQMFFISGSMSKDCTNQILQYIKNKLR